MILPKFHSSVTRMIHKFIRFSLQGTGGEGNKWGKYSTLGCGVN